MLERMVTASQQLLGRSNLAIGHLGLATELLCDFHPGASTLDDQLTLYVGEAGHDVEEEPTRATNCLTLCPKRSNFQTERVSPSRSISRTLAIPGRVSPRSAHLVLKNFLAASLRQGFPLQLKAIILRRGMGTTDQHIVGSSPNDEPTIGAISLPPFGRRRWEWAVRRWPEIRLG